MIQALLPLLGSAGGAAAAGAAGSAGGAASAMNLVGLLGGGSKKGGGDMIKSMLTGPGTTIGGVKSALQFVNSIRAGRQADNAQPAYVDPAQAAMLDEIIQKRRSIESGSAYAPQMADINAAQAGVIQGVTQLAGGDTAAAMQGLLASQSTASRMKNQLLAQANQQNQFYTSLGTDLMNRISDRSLQLQLANRSQKRAEWAQYRQDSFANAANAVARLDTDALMDILSRDNAASPATMEPPVPNAEQQARQLNPIVSMLSADSGLGGAPDTGLISLLAK